VEVGLTGSLRSAAGGAATVEIEAETIRELISRIVLRYPAMNKQIDAGIAVSINGEIYRDNRREKIPAGAEVFLLPRIPGG
jgi:molybdopterin synthase sulfur carrier subunit